MLKIGHFSKRINSKTTEPISINFFLKKKLDFFPYNSLKILCQNSICEIFSQQSEFSAQILNRRKISHRWNFDKNFSYRIVGKQNLVSFKRKFIEIGSVVFELIRFEKCPIFNIERVRNLKKYRLFSQNKNYKYQVNIQEIEKSISYFTIVITHSFFVMFYLAFELP